MYVHVSYMYPHVRVSIEISFFEQSELYALRCDDCFRIRLSGGQLGFP
jgi:hypothetical protein